MFKLVHLGTPLALVPGPNPLMDLFKLVHFWKWEVDLQLKGLFVIIKFFSTPTHYDKHWQCVMGSRLLSYRKNTWLRMMC